MADILFPVYPEGITMINSSIGIKKIEGEGIFYFNESGVFYKHKADDYKNFRFITSQMMDLKQVSQVEVIKFFKISKESAKRWLKVYREKGAEGFFTPPATRKGGTILTKEVIQKIELMLSQSKSIKDIGTELDIKVSTIKKGIQSGRITRVQLEDSNKKEDACVVKTQSSRSAEDASSSIGMGCTNISGRVDALKKK